MRKNKPFLSDSLDKQRYDKYTRSDCMSCSSNVLYKIPHFLFSLFYFSNNFDNKDSNTPGLGSSDWKVSIALDIKHPISNKNTVGFSTPNLY